MIIGGKTKAHKPSKPQTVVQRAAWLNEYALLTPTLEGLTLAWIGDANAATKFDSKYAAKERIRHIVDIPDSRCYKVLEG